MGRNNIFPDKWQIRSGRTGLEINQYGSVVSIMDLKDGYVYFNSGVDGGNLFHILIPTQKWSSRAIIPSLSPPPEISKSKEGFLLIYNNLQIDKKPAGIKIKVRIVSSHRKDEIAMKLYLSNYGRERVTGVSFPWIRGWMSGGDIMLGPCGKLDLSSLPGWTPAWGNGTSAQNSIKSSYPEALMVPWVDFSCEKGGVSCINYQEEPRNCYASIIKESQPDHSAGLLGFLWGFYAYVPPGSEWESPEIGISVHNGDWHRTADRYREWMDGKLTPTKSSVDFRESIGSQHVFFSYFDGTPVRPYEELPEVAAVGRKYGLKELCVWDRLLLGTYCRLAPDEDLLGYSPEEKKVLSKSIKKAVKEGSDVSALVNFRLLNLSLKVSEKYKNELQKALDGSIKMECYPVALIPGNFATYHLGPYCGVFSPFSERYRRRVMKKIDEYIEMGFTSLFYDQPFEPAPDYSHIKSGGIPEMTYPKLLELIGDVRQRIRKKNPEAVIMGEQCEVFASQIIDQWMCWVWSDRDIESGIRLHYACPHTVINCVVDSSPGLAAHAFAAGLHLMIMVRGGFGYLGDVPEFALYVKKLADLRKKCAERTVYARFCELQGFSVELNEGGIVAYSYESTKGPAMIFAAPERAGKITVHINRDYFVNQGKMDNGRIFKLDGSESMVTGDTHTFELDRYEVIVWFA